MNKQRKIDGWRWKDRYMDIDRYEQTEIDRWMDR